MSRSTIANRRHILLDGQLVLRDKNAAAIANTQAETAINLNAAELHYYKAVVDIAAYTGFAAGTAQWQINIEASADNVTFFQVGAVIANGTLSRYLIPLSGEWVEENVPALYNAISYIRVRAVKVGTPSNLTYGAFLAC